MPNLYDIAYGAFLTVTAPVWLVLPQARRRIFKALRHQMGRDFPPRDRHVASIMIHAVSAGEMNATPALAMALRQARPDLHLIISATSDAGMDAARRHYAHWLNTTLIRYPLDFTGPVQRLLNQLRPMLVILMELEVWPNFLQYCARRGVSVIVAQARLTTSSFRNYRRAGVLTRAMFRRIAFVCAQEQSYADRFLKLGVAPDRLRVVGTMKFDTGGIAEGAEALASAVGLRPGAEPIWVCGSTGPGEEQIILQIYRQMLPRHPKLRLVIVPRHPPRFDAVAELIGSAGFGLVRRSGAVNSAGGTAATVGASPIILGDTMGELRAFYAMADIVFVGRTLVDLGPRQHGSDMIEPAALARPIIVGPFTGNFAEPMNCFRAADALRVVSHAGELQTAVEQLLGDPSAAKAMAQRGREVVAREQGATHRHAEIILHELARVEGLSPEAAPVPQPH